MSEDIKTQVRPILPGPKNDRTHVLIGQRLVIKGRLRQEDLDRVLSLQRKLPPDQPVRRIGSLLIKEKLVSLQHVSEELGAQRGTKALRNIPGRLDPHLRSLFPKDLLLQAQAVPLVLIGSAVIVAMTDPDNEKQVALLQAHTTHQLKPVLAPQLQIHRLLATLKKGPPSQAAARCDQPIPISEASRQPPATAATKQTMKSKPTAPPPAAMQLDSKKYRFLAISLMTVAAVVGAGYLLVKQREDRINESAVPLPPRPKVEAPAAVTPPVDPVESSEPTGPPFE